MEDQPSLRIVFMGTPQFAVPSLDRLVQSHHEVVGVITAPDRPAGRGQQPRPSAIKEYAQSAGITVLQPTNLKSTEFQEELASFKADLQVVVAFRMLPEAVWSMPARGTINLHGSLLPQYRGAAPINWAIMNGETKTGVTTFFLQHKIDTGNIIDQKEIDILPGYNVGDVHDIMMEVGAGLLLETVNKIADGSAPSQPQSESNELKEAPKLTKENRQIDWTRSAEDIHNQVRGLAPYPCAWTTIKVAGDDKPRMLKVYKTEWVPNDSHAPGSLLKSEDGELEIGCATGSLRILELQLEGKKRMTTAELLRGLQLDKEQVLN